MCPNPPTLLRYPVGNPMRHRSGIGIKSSCASERGNELGPVYPFDPSGISCASGSCISGGISGAGIALASGVSDGAVLGLSVISDAAEVGAAGAAVVSSSEVRRRAPAARTDHLALAPAPRHSSRQWQQDRPPATHNGASFPCTTPCRSRVSVVYDMTGADGTMKKKRWQDVLRETVLICRARPGSGTSEFTSPSSQSQYLIIASTCSIRIVSIRQNRSADIPRASGAALRRANLGEMQ